MAPNFVQATPDRALRFLTASAVNRNVAAANALVDVCCNDAQHANLHAQTGPEQTLGEAIEGEQESVRNALETGARAVLKGDQKTAENSLGQALHTVQDEKHEFIEFANHTGNPKNDLKTKEGSEQLKTDIKPTQKQLEKAEKRTIQTVRQFENKIRQLGRQEGLSEKEIEKRIKQFKQGKDPKPVERKKKHAHHRTS